MSGQATIAHERATAKLAPLALTMGDPAGIGPELIVRAWRDGAPPFVAICDPDLLDAPTIEIDPHATIDGCADVYARAIPVLGGVRLAAPAIPGRPDPANAPAVIAAIERGVGLARSGAVAGVVTNPISKAVLKAAGFPHPGHTEFLAELTGTAGGEVMMLAGPELRVVLASVHLPLRTAIETLDAAAIIRTGRIAAAALRRDFGIDAPRLAVAGLNPHAGEAGHLGHEEAEIVAPAIAALRAEGIDATGPWPPDTMFTATARTRYDAALCLYHDQGLIPLKTLDVARSVNVTLGLPIVRTSPDHGTAFDIAGQGIADPSSLIAALQMAAAIAARRQS